MLTKKIIKSKCNSMSYERGLELYRMNKVADFEVEETISSDTITAIVYGSGDNIYDIEGLYNKYRDELIDLSCDCPAFYKYKGICKHCVAVLLYYMDYQKLHLNQAQKVMIQKNAQLKLEGLKGYKNNSIFIQKPLIQTTPMIKDLLNQRIRKRTLPIVQNSVYGKVRLQPEVRFVRDSFLMEFKIGITQRYVLKDVLSFVEAIENTKEVYYGKKLKFIHTLESFVPEDRPLVQFLGNWVMNNRERYQHQSHYYQSTPKIREIDLSVEELERFLEIFGDRDFNGYIDNTGVREWRLTEESLQREMTLLGIEGGVEVQINSYFGIKGNQNIIYFHEGKIYRIAYKELKEITDFLNCMLYMPESKIVIQKEDIPVFCRELLPSLEKHFDCKRENFNEEDYGVKAVRFEFYLDAPQKDLISCKVLGVYGENKYNIYNEEEGHLRDKVRELEIGAIITALCNTYDDKEKTMVIVDDEDKIYDMLVYGINTLQEIGEVFISDALKRLNVVSSPRVAVGVSIDGDIMSLQVTSKNMSKEQLIEVLTKYNRKKKYHRLKNGDFINVDGEEIEALLELKEGLHLTGAQLKKENINIPTYRAIYLNEELSETMPFHVNKDQTFKALIRNMKTVEDNDFNVPKNLQNILREYQKIGYLWIKTLNHNGFGGILADDMGLGKTLQVICFLLSEYLESGEEDNKKALIVCPASLVYNWYDEIKKFAPELPVKMVIGSANERKSIVENVENKDILVTSYDLLKRDITYYEGLHFYCEVIDEAQYIKNHKTQTAKGVKLINAGFKLALTGTPIENKLSELWSIFDYLMQGFLYSYSKFREDLEVPIVQSQDERAMTRLQKMITPFVLRRLKSQVLYDLPDKIEENIYACFQGEQQKLYDAHVTRLKLLLDKKSDEEYKTSKIQVLSELTKLRQICCDPSLLYEDYKGESVKLDLCMELVNNAIASGHKVLLFSQFTTMLENIENRLEKKKIQYYSLTGGTKKEKRAKMVEAFNEDDTPVFCISLKAGGTGLNLVAADIVIHFDPWWNIAVQNQATDRAHRIGQKNVVNVYKLIAQGTIEENIVKLQDQKKELANQVLSGEGINLGSFNREEITALLQ